MHCKCMVLDDPAVHVQGPRCRSACWRACSAASRAMRRSSRRSCSSRSSRCGGRARSRSGRTTGRSIGSRRRSTSGDGRAGCGRCSPSGGDGAGARAGAIGGKPEVRTAASSPPGRSSVAGGPGAGGAAPAPEGDRVHGGHRVVEGASTPVSTTLAPSTREPRAAKAVTSWPRSPRPRARPTMKVCTPPSWGLASGGIRAMRISVIQMKGRARHARGR